MKFELWQMMLHVTAVSLISFIVCTQLMSWDHRWGLGVILCGLLISSGPVTLPRSDLRAHVSRDRQLRRWSDVFMFGLPASLLIWVGMCIFWIRSMSLFSVPYGLVVGLLYFIGFCGWVFNRDEDRCS